MITASSGSRITSPIEAELKLGASHFCDGLMDHLGVGSLWVARIECGGLEITCDCLDASPQARITPPNQDYRDLRVLAGT
jgi:hypothetical protein